MSYHQFLMENEDDLFKIGLGISLFSIIFESLPVAALGVALVWAAISGAFLNWLRRRLTVDQLVYDALLTGPNDTVVLDGEVDVYQGEKVCIMGGLAGAKGFEVRQRAVSDPEKAREVAEFFCGTLEGVSDKYSSESPTSDKATVLVLDE